MVSELGFPIFDDWYDRRVWEAVRRLHEVWKGSRIEASRGPRFLALRRKLGWPKKLLSRHLDCCERRGSVVRHEVTRRHVWYEPYVEPRPITVLAAALTPYLRSQCSPQDEIEMDRTLLVALDSFSRAWTPRRGRGRPPGQRWPFILNNTGISGEEAARLLRGLPEVG